MEVAEFIEFCPPSECEYNNFSLNFLRLLYTESYCNPNFRDAKISYNAKKFYNSGIGGALKERVYESGTGTFNRIFYQIFKIFVDQ